MMRALVWMVLWATAISPALAERNPKTSSERSRPTKPRNRETKPKPHKQAESLVLVEMETTFGEIVLELDADHAPISVKNFLRYVDEGFYDGTIFHRVVPHFLIQGGGYMPSLMRKTAGLHPPIRNEWDNGLQHKPLTIAAARFPGKPDSATSEFFINMVDNPRLDRPQEDGAGYAVFGRVVAGKEVIENIRTADLDIHPRYQVPSGNPVTPMTPIVIISARRLDDEGEGIDSPGNPGETDDLQRDKRSRARDSSTKRRSSRPPSDQTRSQDRQSPEKSERKPPEKSRRKPREDRDSPK
ncbi:MAG: peptidylprolyl isomerase [Phycisphaerae bacterium]|nr:peptidylprolyl isomerase [Phycisphaerae bacterium]